MDPYNMPYNPAQADSLELSVDARLTVQVQNGIEAHQYRNAAGGIVVKELTCPQGAADFLDPSGKFREYGFLRVA